MVWLSHLPTVDVAGQVGCVAELAHVVCLDLLTGWDPTMDEIGDLLSCILGVLGLVQELSILSGL